MSTAITTNKNINENTLRNMAARISTASGTFVRYLFALLTAATILAPVLFFVMRIVIGSWIIEFALLPYTLVGIVGIPVGVGFYLASLVKNKPMVCFNVED